MAEEKPKRKPIHVRWYLRLGIVLGAALIGRFFLNMEMDYFEMPQAHIVLVHLVYAVAAACVLVIVLVTWLSCRRILNEPASQALRTEVPAVKNTRFCLTTKGIFRKLYGFCKIGVETAGKFGHGCRKAVYRLRIVRGRLCLRPREQRKQQDCDNEGACAAVPQMQ